MMKPNKTDRFATLTLGIVLLAGMLTLPLQAQVNDYKKIKYPELQSFKVAQPEVVTLSNGLKIFMLEDHELPLISISTRIRTGSNYEPADKIGLAGFLGQVMREGGTTNHSGEELDAFLESRAAFVETGMAGDFGTASMNCLKEDFDEVLPIFADVLLNPAFAEDKLELAKQQAKTGIARRNDDVSGIAGREFARLLYGQDSPLATQLEYATVDAVSRDDLISWHKRYYHPNNIMFSISGDFDSEEMKSKIEKTFGDWNRGPDANLPELTVQETKPGIYFVEKDDVTQASVLMGHRGIRTDNPDYYAVQVMNEVPGGGFSSRLFSNVRSEKGRAYGVGGRIGSSFIRKGLFTVSTSTKSETMAAAIDALNIEIDSIINSPATAAELKRAKESILNSFIFNYTSKAQILGQQLTYAYYGYPADFLDRYQREIGKVTQEDVARVAKKYIHPDQLVTLVVGNSADFDRPVSSFGEVQTVDISIPAPESKAPKMAKNAETLAAGRAILDRAVAKMAGDGTLTSIRIESTVALDMGGQEMELGQEVAIELPDKIRQTYKTPMGDQTVVINGARGVMMAGGQQQPLPASQISDQMDGLSRNISILLSRAADIEAVSGGREEVGGSGCDRIAISLDGSESTLCVADDGRVLHQSYQGQHPMQGTPGELAVTFSDYRDVSGRAVPYEQLLMFEGQQVAKISVTTFNLNETLEAKTFALPE
jgi:predicted Zn-dependent peptidase